MDIKDLKNKLRPHYDFITAFLSSTMGTFSAILDRYPPVKVLFYSFGLLSFLPLLVFLIYFTSSLVIVIGALLFTGTVVQTSIVAFGGFWLFWWVVAAAIGASILVFWFTIGLFGVRTGMKLSK